MIEAVLFDFDGVIVKSEDLHRRTFLELLAPYNVEVSEERWYREFAGTGSRRIFAALAEEYGADIDVDAFVERRRERFIELAMKGELDVAPGLRQFLSYLNDKGVKSAVVSGGHRKYIELLLGQLELSESFAFIVSAEDIPARKPDPEPFLHAARKLGVRPANCLVIEDSYAGCAAARSAGMKLIWMIPHESIPSPECDLAVGDFNDPRIRSLL